MTGTGLALLSGSLAAAVLLWPGPAHRLTLQLLPASPVRPRLTVGAGRQHLPSPRHPLVTGRGDGPTGRHQPATGRRRLGVRREPAPAAADLLALVEAIAPALEAGLTPAAALRLAGQSRVGDATGDAPGDPVTALTADLAALAADGAQLGPAWLAAAEACASPELRLLAQAWALTDDTGAPLADAVRTTADLLRAGLTQQRRLAASVAGAWATINVLTLLPLGGPAVAAVLGIDPRALYLGSPPTLLALAFGLLLVLLGRWWVASMVAAVAKGPVVT